MPVMKPLSSIAALVLTAASLHAKTITVSFEAKIQGGTEGTRYEEKLKPGTLVTGMFTYDSEAKDVNEATEYGEYYFKVPKYRMLVNLANTPLESAPGERYYIFCGDNSNAWEDYQGTDDFVVAAENILCPDPWLGASTMFIQSSDSPGEALASTALPSGFPDPKLFDWSILFITGTIGLTAEITKYANDDSLYKPVVQILPASGEFLQTQSIEPVIRIDGVKPEEVRLEKILLDDVDVTKRYLPSSRQGELVGDECATLWQLASPRPSPGSHVLKVEVSFKGKPRTTAEVNWNILHAKLSKNPRKLTRTETKTNPDAVPNPVP